MSGRTVRATLRPGQHGTRKLEAKLGDRLVCVCHRIDEERGRRLITLELIVEESPLVFHRLAPSLAPRTVRVRIDLTDRSLRHRIIAAGGRWIVEEQCWQRPARAARRLGITSTGRNPE